MYLGIKLLDDSHKWLIGGRRKRLRQLQKWGSSGFLPLLRAIFEYACIAALATTLIVMDCVLRAPQEFRPRERDLSLHVDEAASV